MRSTCARSPRSPTPAASRRAACSAGSRACAASSPTCSAKASPRATRPWKCVHRRPRAACRRPWMRTRWAACSKRPRTTRSASATSRSWSCSIPPACASRSSPASTSRPSTSPTARSGCSARAARRASCRWAARRWPRCAHGSPSGRRLPARTARRSSSGATAVGSARGPSSCASPRWHGAKASPSACIRTSSGIHSPPISWNPAPIFAECRSFWVMPTSARPRSTPTSISSTSPAPTTRRIPGRNGSA